MLKFGVLGPIAILDEEGGALPSRSKTSALLAVLLVSPRQVHSLNRIIAMLWGSSPPRSAGSMVREHVKKVRSALGKNCLLRTTRDGYLLDVSAAEIDAGRFEEQIAVASMRYRSGDFGGATTLVDDALSLWRDERAFADVRDVVALDGEAHRLEEIRFQAEELLVQGYLLDGRAAAALPILRRLTVRYPIHERFWLLLMAAQYAVGRTPEACETYREARRRYTETVGLDLDSAFEGVHRAILGRASVESVIAMACPLRFESYLAV